MHGFLTRDGIAPASFLELARADLSRYTDVVEFRACTVEAVTPRARAFEVRLEDGATMSCRKVLLATGVRDELPPIDGLEAFYGRSVHHCPYCDGWEHRDQTIAVVGRGTSGAGLALSLKTWTPHVILCTNGAPAIRRDDRVRLQDAHIVVNPARIARIDHEGAAVRSIVYADGTTSPCDAIFFAGGQSQQCELPARLGCHMNHLGTVKTDHLGQTHIPGLYVVGDASRDVQFVIVAAAEGAKAGVAINKALQRQAGLAVAPQTDAGTSPRTAAQSR
jgi:thioredoxin reductase